MFWSERKIFSLRNPRLLFDGQPSEEDRGLLEMLMRLVVVLVRMAGEVLGLVAGTEDIWWADILLI